MECDFIAPRVRYDDVADPATRDHLMSQHRLTLSNCFAQSRALMLGDAALEDEGPRPGHKRYAGNQPSSTLLLDRLTPRTLGALVALYEHKVFVQATIWDINPSISGVWSSARRWPARRSVSLNTSRAGRHGRLHEVSSSRLGGRVAGAGVSRAAVIDMTDAGHIYRGSGMLNAMQVSTPASGILYLHGFNSGSASPKAALMRAACEHLSLPCVTPQLPHRPDRALAVAEACLDELGMAPMVVGSSMGGFLATLVAERHDLPAA